MLAVGRSEEEGHASVLGHDPERFEEFARRYEEELGGSDAWQRLQEIVAEHSRVTLLFGASDREHNQAVVLQALLTR